jgi:hypothetical protein
VNDFTNSVNILDCKNRDSNALIGYPNLTGPVLDRFQPGIIRLTLSDCSRNASQKQNPTKDGHFADNDLHAVPAFFAVAKLEVYIDQDMTGADSRAESSRASAFPFCSHKSVIGWLDSVDKSHCPSVNIRREAR